MIKSYSKKAKFEDVLEDLKLAIEARGLVIDFHSHIHRMLERTGKDVGSDRKIYADAQAFVFCSASLSRKTMEADAANIALCPYSIVVYAKADEPEKVYVAYESPVRPDSNVRSQMALKEVDKLLDDIAREALGVK